MWKQFIAIALVLVAVKAGFAWLGADGRGCVAPTAAPSTWFGDCR